MPLAVLNSTDTSYELINSLRYESLIARRGTYHNKTRFDEIGQGAMLINFSGLPTGECLGGENLSRFLEAKHVR